MSNELAEIIKRNRYMDTHGITNSLMIAAFIITTFGGVSYITVIRLCRRALIDAGMAPTTKGIER